MLKHNCKSKFAEIADAGTYITSVLKRNDGDLFLVLRPGDDDDEVVVMMMVMLMVVGLGKGLGWVGDLSTHPG